MLKKMDRHSAIPVKYSREYSCAFIANLTSSAGRDGLKRTRISVPRMRDKNTVVEANRCVRASRSILPAGFDQIRCLRHRDESSTLKKWSKTLCGIPIQKGRHRLKYPGTISSLRTGFFIRSKLSCKSI